MANRIKVNKPTGKEDQSQAILRAIAMKRETYFQGILYNIIQTGKNTNIKEMVDVALEGADYVIEKLYPIKAEVNDE